MKYDCYINLTEIEEHVVRELLQHFDFGFLLTGNQDPPYIAAYIDFEINTVYFVNGYLKQPSTALSISNLQEELSEYIDITTRNKYLSAKLSMEAINHIKFIRHYAFIQSDIYQLLNNTSKSISKQRKLLRKCKNFYINYAFEASTITLIKYKGKIVYSMKKQLFVPGKWVNKLNIMCQKIENNKLEISPKKAELLKLLNGEN